jgi:hypothetical protein
MMKRFLSLLIIFGSTVVSSQSHNGSTFRTQSYYGFSGLTFIPTTQVLPAKQWDISYLSKPSTGEDIGLDPFSLQICASPFKDGFEVAMTNTAQYASFRDLGGVGIDHGYSSLTTPLPVFPSVKYQFMPMIKANFQTAMAVGFSLPYGAYYVVDKFFNCRIVDITVHSGVATKLTTYHAFAGAVFTFGARTGEIERDFPLEMLIEGSWGGSLKQLNEKEEAFIAVSFRQAWTSCLFIKTFIRLDNQPFVRDKKIVHDSPIVRMGIGLDYAWRHTPKTTHGGQ